MTLKSQAWNPCITNTKKFSTRSEYEIIGGESCARVDYVIKVGFPSVSKWYMPHFFFAPVLITTDHELVGIRNFVCYWGQGPAKFYRRLRSQYQTTYETNKRKCKRAMMILIIVIDSDICQRLVLYFLLYFLLYSLVNSWVKSCRRVKHLLTWSNLKYLCDSQSINLVR